MWFHRSLDSTYVGQPGSGHAECGIVVRDLGSRAELASYSALARAIGVALDHAVGNDQSTVPGSGCGSILVDLTAELVPVVFHSVLR